MQCVTTSPLGNFFDLSPLISDSGYLVRGIDYKANFTLNVCAPTSSHPDSAAFYYDSDDQVQSLGTVSDPPYFRGRNLLLEYRNGSPCLGPNGEPSPFRKSAVLTFKCDISDDNTRVSYVANADECSYLFEVHTPHACPSVNSRESISPFSIFFLITLVAVLVYSSRSCRPLVARFHSSKNRNSSLPL